MVKILLETPETVLITAIYVVATVFICIYNGWSAKAAKKQT